jgi:hypothetical protein
MAVNVDSELYTYQLGALVALESDTIVGFDPLAPAVQQVRESSELDAIGVSLDRGSIGGGDQLRVVAFSPIKSINVRHDGVSAIALKDILRFSDAVTGQVTKDTTESKENGFLIAVGISPAVAGARVSVLLRQMRPTQAAAAAARSFAGGRPAAADAEKSLSYVNDFGAQEHSDGEVWMLADGTKIGGGV